MTPRKRDSEVWAAILLFVVVLTLVVGCQVQAQRECMAEGHSFFYCWALFNR